MSLEGSGPAIGRPPRRRGMESNHHPAFFKRVREPSLLPRQNWLRDQELHLATPAYEAGSTLGLPALRNLVAAVGYDPTRSRQSARSRALIRRTRSPEPTAEVERGTGNDPATSCLASKRSPTELPPQIGGDGRNRTDIGCLQNSGPPVERRPRKFQNLIVAAPAALVRRWRLVLGLPRTCRVD